MKRSGAAAADGDRHKQARSDLMHDVADGSGGGTLDGMIGGSGHPNKRKPVTLTCSKLRSLRLALKSIYTEADDTRPAMIMPISKNHAMPPDTQYGAGIPIIDTASEADGTLHALMTAERTGLLVQDQNRVGSRFASWFIPCDTIHNLDMWPPGQRWFVNPQELIVKLKEYDAVKSTVRFDDRHVTFSFREMSNHSCGRLKFNTHDCDDVLHNPYVKMQDERIMLSARMTATDMLRKLRTLVVNKSSAFRVQLHDLKMGTVHTQAVTFSSVDEAADSSICIGYINDTVDPSDPVMNFRRSAAAKKRIDTATATATADDDDDDDEDTLGAEADAEIAAAASDSLQNEDDLDKYIRWSERYHGALRAKEDVRQYGDVLRDTHSLFREEYRLILDQTFSIAELLAMFKDIANDLPSGISIPLCGDSDNRCLTIVTPLADGSIGVHRIMAKLIDDCDDDDDDDDDDV